MKILALDSSAVSASVALSDDDKILSSDFINAGITHSQSLMPMVESVLKRAQTDISEIDLFAVTNGPGSFTGVRIGVSTIKGLAFPLAKKCIGVSTLELIAMNLEERDCIVLSAMDARRAQIYTATFRIKSGKVQRLTPDEAVAAQSVAQRVNSYGEEVFVSGDGAALAYDILKNDCPKLILPEEKYIYQNAEKLCRLAYAHSSEAQCGAALIPRYLRLSQAERELNNRKGEIK